MFKVVIGLKMLPVFTNNFQTPKAAIEAAKPLIATGQLIHVIDLKTEKVVFRQSKPRVVQQQLGRTLRQHAPQKIAQKDLANVFDIEMVK